MLRDHFNWVLWVTGAVTTVGPLLQFIAPRQALKRLYQIELSDDAGLLFARHWGLVAAVIGASLLYAAGHEAVRPVVVAAALVEKAGLVGLIALEGGQPFAKGLRGAAAFDAVCVLLYSGWFLS